MSELELRFRKTFCNGAELPEEVRRGLVGGGKLPAVLADAEVKWLDPLEVPSLISNDYLTEDDLKNPDTASNVEATAELFGRIAWLVVNDEEGLFGYWLADAGALSFPAIAVSYDSEGTFSAWGELPLADLIAYAGSFGDDDAYARVAAVAKQAGLTVAHDSLPAMFKTADACTFDIEELHDQAYNKARAARGLEPIS